MRTLIIILSFMACYSGSALGDEPVIPADKAVIQFDTKLGTVTFNHQMHSGLSFAECTTCHHTQQPGETVKTCHECHNDESPDAPKAKKAFHTRCTGCHEYTAEKGDQAGPLSKKCKLCHVK
jgi:hypothetical protein